MGACGSRAAKETVVDVADVALEKVPERRSAEEPTPEELEDAYEQALEAIEAGDATALANLLKSHAVPARMLVRLAGGEQDDTPLHAAALGEPECVSPLLAAGAKANARNKAGLTPLMCAAAYGDVEVARLLLAAGADASIADCNEHEATWHAKDGGNADVVEILEEPPPVRRPTVRQPLPGPAHCAHGCWCPRAETPGELPQAEEGPGARRDAGRQEGR